MKFLTCAILFSYVDHCDMLMSASIGLMHESQEGTTFFRGS